MSKIQISASVDSETVKALTKKASNEKRSFSQVVDMILQDAISKPKSKTQSQSKK